MNAKGWMLSAGLGAAAGAVAVLMMPRQNPVRRVAAKAANKAEDLAWKVEDKMNEVLCQVNTEHPGRLSFRDVSS